ncbi:hypothetical protein AWG80_25545 [Escherichia coli]|nr:hypothetical protein AWG80_25545 [Escherichia coli]
MIVKFHARGKGGGSGPVDYLLGRERNREGATVLQGNPEEVRELIDATPFAKKYTSGVLSFAEKELPPGGREKVMASFERVLMPGLEKNQYSILWVEHQDKGRLELNFVIPNMELQTGKRLQPYYDRASVHAQSSPSLFHALQAAAPSPRTTEHLTCISSQMAWHR